MQLFMLQLLTIVVAAALIGSTQAAIATLPNAQEFATSTSTATLANIDALLALAQQDSTADSIVSSSIDSDTKLTINSFTNTETKGNKNTIKKKKLFCNTNIYFSCFFVFLLFLFIALA